MTSPNRRELARHLPDWLAAGLLGTIVFLPTAIFPFIPCAGPDKRLAGESFGEFGREVLALLRRREVLIALVLLISPCSSFALTNLLGGLGGDFHASPRVVSLAGGAGAFFPGILGCLLFPIIAKRRPLLFLYLADGVLGSLFTLSLILLPHTPVTFTLALIGEYLFQAFAFAIQVGVMFETIGQNNPLARNRFHGSLGGHIRSYHLYDGRRRQRLLGGRHCGQPLNGRGHQYCFVPGGWLSAVPA